MPTEVVPTLPVTTSLLLELPVWRHGHGPVELVPQRLGEDLVDGHLAALAPGNGDARVHVVDLGRAQRHLLVLVAVADVHLQLAQVLGPLLDAQLHARQGGLALEHVLLVEPPLLVL